jgi:hypothetical protein
MHLQDAVVSRKTPADGKLEITAATAARLRELGDPLPLSAPDGEAMARIESMECTCAKAAGARHTHHFVVSPLLRGLVAGSEVRVQLDEGRIGIHPASQ